MKRIVMLASAVGLLLGGIHAQEPDKSRLICGFDSPADLAGIEFTDVRQALVTDKDLVTQGAAALRLGFARGGGYPGLLLTGARLRGWEAYDLLVLDVRVLGDKPFVLTMRFDDAGTRNYETRAHFNKTLQPGLTAVKIPLKLLTRENGQPFDAATLRQFFIFTGALAADVEVVFDNLRLENERVVKVEVPGAKLFDFGSATSMTFPGFTKVTPDDVYDAAKGFGLLGTGRLSGTNSGFPDDLAGDWVEGGSPAFRVDVPDGQYRVLVWAFNPDGAYSVELGGQKIGERRAPLRWSKEGLFRGIDDDYYPGKDLWKSYVEPDYPCYEANVAATGGKLEVVCRGGRLAGVVVYPVKVEEQMKAVLAEVLKGRREKFARDYCTVRVPKPNGPASKPTAEEEKRGYIVFFPRVTDVVYPSTVPTEESTGAKLKMGSARGQRVSGTLAVYPLRGFGCLRAFISGLKTAGKGEIPGGNCQVRLVRYFERPESEAIYVPKPTQLVERDVQLYPGFTRQYWLTVEVPADAQPGIYRGAVELTSGDGTDSTVPVELEVYPFSLPASSRATFAFYYYAPFGAEQLAGSGKTFAQVLEPEIVDMERHGLNTMQVPLPRIVRLGPDRIQLDYSELETYVMLMKKHDFGLRHRPQMLTINLANYLKRQGLTEFSERFNLAFKNTLADVDKWFRDRGVEVMFCLVDEPREQALNAWNRNLDDTMRYLRLCREIPGLRTTVTVMSDVNSNVSYLPMIPLMDVLQTHPTSQSEKMMALALKDGKPELQLFNAGTDRLSYGFGVWKLRGLGRWQWHYCWPDTSYHPFRGEHWAVVYPSPDGPVPTVAYEQVAEGITDYRYAEHLEALMAQAQGRGVNTDAARLLLDEIRSAVPQWWAGAVGDGTDVGEVTGDVRDKLDAWRARLAVEIIALREALAR